MLGIVLFVTLGYHVSISEKPFHSAGLYAVIVGILGLVFGASIVGAIIIMVVNFIYASIVYYILDSFGDGIFMFLLILFVGTVGLFFFPL